MRTLEELRQFYETELVGDLRALEEERRGISRRLKVAGIALIAVFLLVAYAISGIPVVVALLACPGIWLLLEDRLSKGYKRRFSKTILQRLVPFIDENLAYSRDATVPPELLRQSGIFNPLKGYYRTEDVISGKVGKTQVLFFELKEDFNTMSAMRSQSRKSLFDGLFFIADFNKNFSGETEVLPGVGKTIARFGPGESRFQDVELEDPEFESLFGVSSTDQVEARYILSTSLMQRIVDFRKKAGKPIYISFAGSKIFVAIPYSGSLFEPPIFGTLFDFRKVEEYYEDIKFAEGIVEDLNLNTRIWGKQ